VFRSLNHVYAQVIDDVRGHTLASASTLDADLRGTKGTGVERARAVGTAIGERAKAAGITQVVFDRAGYLYHGRVKALADAAREAGLEF
jgi:large subunit ribosomal protein L18